MFHLCLASLLHIFLNLCNFIFSFKSFFFFIIYSSVHLFFVIYLFVCLVSYLVEICLDTCLVECPRESFYVHRVQKPRFSLEIETKSYVTAL